MSRRQEMEEITLTEQGKTTREKSYNEPRSIRATAGNEIPDNIPPKEVFPPWAAINPPFRW